MSRGATNLLVASCRDAIIIGHEPSLSARAGGGGRAGLVGRVGWAFFHPIFLTIRMSRGSIDLLVASCHDVIIIGHEPSLSAWAGGCGWAGWGFSHTIFLSTLFLTTSAAKYVGFAHTNLKLLLHTDMQ